MRDLRTIMDRCLAEIPNESEVYEPLTKSAERVKNQIGFTPPEIMADRWVDWVNTLQIYLGEPDTDWKRRVEDIMAGKE